MSLRALRWLPSYCNIPLSLWPSLHRIRGGESCVLTLTGLAQCEILEKLAQLTGTGRLRQTLSPSATFISYH